MGLNKELIYIPKDLSKMSDHEINCAVLIKLGYQIDHLYKQHNPEANGAMIMFGPKDGKVFDYCNNPNDIMSVLFDHGISLIHNDKTGDWNACCKVTFDLICMSPDGNDNGVLCFDSKYDAFDKHPLKAGAMCLQQLMKLLIVKVVM